jgi:hypothetical protein
MTQTNFLGAPQQQQQKSSSTTTRRLPDNTVHNPPGAMLTIGWIGVIAGVGANLWQMLTTIFAFLLMFSLGRSSAINLGDITFWICALIAFSFQFALLMLVFRIDTAWKKHKVNGTGSKKQHASNAIRATAVEIVQQVSLVLVWGALAFIVDTIGDYTFIGSRTANLDETTAAFIIFSYAVALYALSTVAFVRSIEYLWAGYAAADNLKRDRDHQAIIKDVKE